MMINKKFILFSILISIFLLNGCATITGPSVSEEEITKATDELKVKALAFQIKQLQRLHNIANRLAFSITKEDTYKSPQPFLGIVCFNIDNQLKKLYKLENNKGVVVIIVKENSPAYKVGIMQGDVLISINDRKIPDIYTFNRLASNFKIGDLLKIKILRNNTQLDFDLKLEEIPINIPLAVVDIQEVNAATDGKSIFVTYGLLNFAKSDDEIAAVIAHELAHLVRGHVSKMQGSQLIGALATILLGMVVESSAPGSGEIVMKGAGQISEIFTAQYSRDLEREADYFGTKFVYQSGYDPQVYANFLERFAIEIPQSMISNYLSTHPTSPERILRVKKTIEELKSSSQALN
ncbi:MAG: M48 family metallopeptidase [Candidatus Omnitrophica bacterium]|nr:M48 family metallopeptidase [Candidatus Omnitrophota bacterium]MCM8827242.1 M48 family metallopeptidase [Candidatus Omnitrophota bacterium]